MPRKRGGNGRGGARQVKRSLKPFSRMRFDELDQRILEAKEERSIIAGLTDHVGGQPTFPQMLLIKRIARSVIMLATIEKRVLDTLDLGDLEARQMIALANSIRLSLRDLGLKRPQLQAPQLSDYIGKTKQATPLRLTTKPPKLTVA
jgi:hypothetical protein